MLLCFWYFFPSKNATAHKKERAHNLQDHSEGSSQIEDLSLGGSGCEGNSLHYYFLVKQYHFSVDEYVFSYYSRGQCPVGDSALLICLVGYSKSSLSRRWVGVIVVAQYWVLCHHCPVQKSVLSFLSRGVCATTPKSSVYYQIPVKDYMHCLTNGGVGVIMVQFLVMGVCIILS